MKGKITQWFDDKGYGFIQCDDIPFDVFAHISQLKMKVLTPKIGDNVTFELHWNNGKASAIEISLVTSKRVSSILMLLAVVIVLTGTAVFFNYLKNQISTPFTLNNPVRNYNVLTPQQPNYNIQRPLPLQYIVPKQQQFTCQGKTHCSHMVSYEEAVFYLRNCPNTRIDGDYDGKPFERQFGVH